MKCFEKKTRVNPAKRVITPTLSRSVPSSSSAFVQADGAGSTHSQRVRDRRRVRREPGHGAQGHRRAGRRKPGGPAAGSRHVRVEHTPTLCSASSISRGFRGRASFPTAGHRCALGKANQSESKVLDLPKNARVIRIDRLRTRNRKPFNPKMSMLPAHSPLQASPNPHTSVHICKKNHTDAVMAKPGQGRLARPTQQHQGEGPWSMPCPGLPHGDQASAFTPEQATRWIPRKSPCHLRHTSCPAPTPRVRRCSALSVRNTSVCSFLPYDHGQCRHAQPARSVLARGGPG